MEKNYTQRELNEILLSKKLDEFYFAVIENRGDLLTTEEYEKITKSDDVVYSGASKEEIESLSKKFLVSEEAKGIMPDIMRALYSLAQIRYVAILTMIDDKVYDINMGFLDLERNKIIHFENITKYYNETNARIKLVSPEEEPQLKIETALLDTDDETNYYKYENMHIHQEESEDLTEQFIEEYNQKKLKLK